jgi:hypothetical protein
MTGNVSHTMAQIRARRIVSAKINKGELRPRTKNQETKSRIMQDVLTSLILFSTFGIVVALWELVEYAIKSIFKSKK